MPSVKMPKKSTDTDMTPFVDVAFLILSFFMLATKFKPPEPVPVTMPNSVSAEKLKESDNVMITVDKDSKVYFTVSSPKDPVVFKTIIESLNSARSLGLTPAEMSKFNGTTMVGVPFASLKQFLNLSLEQQNKTIQPGIPVLDSATNELVWWVSAAKQGFANKRLVYLVKGDNTSKYPTFDGVISALKRNEEFKYNLITSPEDVPNGSALDLFNQQPAKK